MNTFDDAAPDALPFQNAKLWRWDSVRCLYEHVASGSREDMDALADERCDQETKLHRVGVGFVVTARNSQPKTHPANIPGARIVPGIVTANQDDDHDDDHKAERRTEWATAQVRVGDLHDIGSDNIGEVVKIGDDWAMVLHVFSQDHIPSDEFRAEHSTHLLDAIDVALTGRGVAHAVALVASGPDGYLVQRFMWFDLITVQIPATP